MRIKVVKNNALGFAQLGTAEVPDNLVFLGNPIKELLKNPGDSADGHRPGERAILVHLGHGSLGHKIWTWNSDGTAKEEIILRKGDWILFVDLEGPNETGHGSLSEGAFLIRWDFEQIPQVEDWQPLAA